MYGMCQPVRSSPQMRAGARGRGLQQHMPAMVLHLYGCPGRRLHSSRAHGLKHVQKPAHSSAPTPTAIRSRAGRRPLKRAVGVNRNGARGRRGGANHSQRKACRRRVIGQQALNGVNAADTSKRASVAVAASDRPCRLQHHKGHVGGGLVAGAVSNGVREGDGAAESPVAGGHANGGGRMNHPAQADATPCMEACVCDVRAP